MSNKNDLHSIQSGIIASALTQEITERTYRMFSDADHLSELAHKWRNVAADKAQGHMFEQLEVLKFNSDALKKDSSVFAKTTASMGLPTDPVDIVISNGKKLLRDVQVKSCNSAARSAFALSDAKYSEMMRLAPKDQTKKIEELLKQRIKSGTLKAEDYQKTLENLKEGLAYENIASGGTNYHEAIHATSQKNADKIANQFKVESALTDMHKSGKLAGNVSAGITGMISGGSNAIALYQGEKDFAEVAVDVVIESAKSYATGYTVTALSKGVTHASSHFLGAQVAKSLARSNAPVAIASGVVAAGKSLASYLNGDISAEEMLEAISHTAITNTSSFYYGALGQVAIPIPVVGALVGASVGYFIGNILHQSGLIALGDSAVVKAAKERRRQVEAMCLAVIPKIQKDRAELERQLSLHFSQRKEVFTSAFRLMSDSLINWDPDEYVSALSQINQQFNAVLPFETFEEFDAFMLSDEVFKF